MSGNSITSKELKALLEYNPIPVFVLDQNGQYLDANSALLEFMSRPREEIIGAKLLDTSPVHLIEEQYSLLFPLNTAKTVETHHLIDGQLKILLVKLYPTTISENKMVIAGIGQDISTLKECQIKLSRTNILYATLNELTLLFSSIKDRKLFFKDICKTVVETGKFRMGWIGLHNTENGKMKPVAVYGHEEGFLSQIRPEGAIARTEIARTIDSAVKAGKLFIGDLDSDDRGLPGLFTEVTKRNYHSIAVIPLKIEKNTIGALSIFSNRRHFFNEDREILEKIGEGISAALEKHELEEQNRKHREELRRSQKRFYEALDNMVEGCQIIGFEWRYVFLNKTIIKMFRKPKEDMIGKSCRDIFPLPEDDPAYIAMHECMEKRVPRHLARNIVNPVGQKEWINISILPIPEGIFVLTLNFTKQKKIEDELLQMNRLLLAVRAVNRHITQQKDPQQLLDLSCKSLVQIRGYELCWAIRLDQKRHLLMRANYKGEMPLEKLRLQLEKGLIPNCVKLAMETGQAVVTQAHSPVCVDCPKHTVFRSGSKMITAPITYSGLSMGVITAIAGENILLSEEETGLFQELANDLGFALHNLEVEEQREKAERTLANREEFFRHFTEIAQDIIYRVDFADRSRLSYISPSIKNTLGYTPAEAVNDPDWLRNTVSPEDRDLYISMHADHKNILGKPYVNRRIHKNGKIVYLETRNSPVRDENGKIIAMIGISRDITERIQIEGALKEAETFNTRLLENSMTPILVAAEDSTIRYTNPALQRLTGFTSEELTGRKMPFPWWPSEKIEEYSRIEPHADQDHFGMERLLQKKNGDCFWVFMNVTRIKDQGKVQFIFSSWQDITERKKTEERDRYQAMLMDTVSDAIVSTDMETTIVSWNKAAEDIYGWKREEVIGRKLTEIIRPGNYGGSLEELQLALQATGHWKGELIHYRGTGEPINVLSSANLIKDNTGKNVGIVAITKDITEIKKAQEQVILNEARLESLLRISQFEGTNVKELFDLALEEAIRLTRSRIGYIFGYSEDRNELYLNAWSKEVHDECKITGPSDVYKLEKTGLWGEAVRQRKAIVINNYNEFHSLKRGYPEGHVALNRFMTIPVFIDRKIVALVGVANKSEEYDSTDLRQLTLLMDATWKIVEKHKIEAEREEAALKIEELYRKEKHQREELQEEARARGLFVDVLAHELRTPLTPILASTGMLSELLTRQGDSIQNRLISNILDSTRALTQRLEELLDLARYSRGTFRLNLQPMDIPEFILGVISRFKPTTEQRNQVIEVSVNRNIPVMNVDPSRLEQVLINLLSNASKFSPEKSTIRFWTKVNQTELVINIQDNGIGISTEEQSRLFQPYHRVEQDRQKFPGIGLGLAVSKQIVEAHGGQIKLKSRVGVGSTFSIHIPLDIILKSANI